MTDGRDQGICQILDTNFTKMVHDLESYMRSFEDQIAKDRSDFYTPKIKALEAKIQEQEQAISEMESASSDSTAELVRKEAVIARLVQICARLHQRVRNGKSCSKSFNLWTEMSIDRPILIRAFKRIYFVNQLKRTLFRRWVRNMRRKREGRFSHEIHSRFEKESRARAADNNRILKSLDVELAAAREELEQKQQSFLAMQQRLRKAFMRGVVNLNLEAMDVFNGAQFMDLMQEVEGDEAEHIDEEAPVNESDDEFFVEEDAPQISVIRHH
jgi:uncharacterized coiled-coil protein SlyX